MVLPTSAAVLLTGMGEEAGKVAPQLQASVVRALERGDLAVACLIFETLKTVDQKTAGRIVEDLKKLLKHERTSVQASAISFARKTESAGELAPDLIEVAGGAHPLPARKAVWLLAKLEAPAGQVVPALVRALGHEDPMLVLAAAEALKTHGKDGAPAVPSLMKALERDDARIRRKAIETLDKIGPAA
jgi:HEAT repeat protein